MLFRQNGTLKKKKKKKKKSCLLSADDAGELFYFVFLAKFVDGGSA